MRSEGQTMPGGPLTVKGITGPTDPTLHRVAPVPPTREPEPKVRKTYTRLTDEQRRTIHTERAQGVSAVQLAHTFGVTPNAVWRIANDDRWAP